MKELSDIIWSQSTGALQNTKSGYATLEDFWTAYENCLIGRYSDIVTFHCRFGDWTPYAGWFRGIITKQNSIGNGKYYVDGSILMTDGFEWWIGTVNGGKNDTSDLTVSWDIILTGNNYNSNTLSSDTITLNTGVDLEYGDLHVYKQGKICSFSICVYIKGDPENEILVGTLPSGYCPRAQYVTNTSINAHNECDGIVKIYTSGKIHIRTTTIEEGDYWISCTYIG